MEEKAALAELGPKILQIPQPEHVVRHAVDSLAYR